MPTSKDHLPPPLPRLLARALKLPLSPTKQALQIVPIQLRAWLSDQTDTACRPWYILCLELYPRGKVINQRLHNPASQKPTADHLLAFLLHHMLTPPSDEPCHRPTHVSFLDPRTTARVAPLLAPLKIQTATLSLADGVQQYVRTFSDRLIQLEKATRADASERPGLLKHTDIPIPVCSALYSAAVEMYRVTPWARIPEHIALEIKLPSASKQDRYRDRYYCTVLGSDQKAFGFALMPSLSELRLKYRRAVLPRDEIADDDDDDDGALFGDAVVGGKGAGGDGRSGDRVGMRDEILVCGTCGRRVGEVRGAGDGARYVYRCGGCRRLLYCDERCQKLDWRARHRDECRQATQDPDYVFKREEWGWLNRELALLFLDPTAVPFDDLDAVEEHGWAFLAEESPPLYPMPFVTVQGSSAAVQRMDRPSLKEIGYMTLVAKAMKECVSPPPSDGVLHLASGVSISVAENLAESLHSPI